MSDPILLEWQGASASLTLNRPERANVLDAEMSAALQAAVRELAAAAHEGRLRSLLISANGAQFCAGGDINGFNESGALLARALDHGIPPLHQTIHALATLPVPVVTALNGSVGGGGIGLALCGDIVLAAASMKLRGGYSALGLTPDLGTSWQLARLVGPMRAKQILYTNEPWNAQRCLAAGLVAEVLPDDAVVAVARSLAQRLAKGATASLARIKSLVDGAADRTLSEQMAMEHQGMVAAGGTREAAEGVQAFIDRRAPRFGG